MGIPVVICLRRVYFQGPGPGNYDSHEGITHNFHRQSLGQLVRALYFYNSCSKIVSNPLNSYRKIYSSDRDHYRYFSMRQLHLWMPLRRNEMKKQLLLGFVFLAGCACLQAQFSSTATAATGAEIIEPLGTITENGRLSGIFNAGYTQNRIELLQEGMKFNGQSPLLPGTGLEIPFFRIISAGQAYSITLSAATLLYHQQNPAAQIRVENTSLHPGHSQADPGILPDKYWLEATLIQGPRLPPGIYSSPQPCRVTVHFN